VNSSPLPKSATGSTRKSTIKFDREQLLDTVIAAAVGDGRVREPHPDFAEARSRHPLIVVAAAPKSGSTFLVNTLIQLTGLPGFRLSSAYATNEHDLYLPALCLMNASGCVTQLHMKGTFHNAALMRTFGIRPIILVRRIADIVVSLKHDLRKKGERSYQNGRQGYSFLWQDQDTLALTGDRLIDLIIDIALPWFVNFYVSWYRLCEQGDVDAMWLTYEEMFADKAGSVRRVIEFLGLPEIGPIDPKVLERRYGTYRDGRIGQGASLLTQAQEERIQALLAYYPGVDFGKYGL
jgi:hypothetical protein